MTSQELWTSELDRLKREVLEAQKEIGTLAITIKRLQIKLDRVKSYEARLELELETELNRHKEGKNDRTTRD